MSRFDAVLLDYGNTVVQFDRAQIESIHAALSCYLSTALGPLEAEALGAVRDDVCVRAPLSKDKRELTACEQMGQVLSAAYGRPFADHDEQVVAADREYQRLFVESLAVDELAARAIGELRAQVPVGLISNYPCGATLRRSLARIGLGRSFWPIVISGEVGYVKPHAKLFAAALEALRLPAERVLLVERHGRRAPGRNGDMPSARPDLRPRSRRALPDLPPGLHDRAPHRAPSHRRRTLSGWRAIADERQSGVRGRVTPSTRR